MVGPEMLLNEIKAYVTAMAITYGAVSLSSGTEPYRLLWAKADRKTSAIHRLVYHMIDVGSLSTIDMGSSLHPLLKQRLATWLNLPIDETGRLIAFWRI